MLQSAKQFGTSNFTAPKLVVYSGAGIAVPDTFMAATYSAPWIMFGTVRETALVSADATANTLTIAANNGRLDTAETVKFVSTTGALPSPLVLNTIYYVVNVTGGVTFQVSSSEGGSPIDLTTAGSGTTNLWLGNTDLGSGLSLGRSLDSSCPSWAAVNTANGVYDWSVMDDYMTYHYTDNGRKLLYCFYQTPTWAAPSATLDAYGYAGGGEKPTDLTYAATFATALLSRYNAVSAFNPGGAKMIHAVEVWNEPSFAAPGTASTTWCGTMADLAQQTKNIYNAVKAVDSSCLVLSPGFTSGMAFSTYGGSSATLSNWLIASDGAGGYGKDWIDGVCYHGYGVGQYPQDAHFVPGWITKLRENVTQAGMAANTPLYQTERGIDEGFGAAHARTAVVEAALGVQCSVVYKYDSYGDNPRDDASVKTAVELAKTALCGKTLTYCAILQNGQVQFTANSVTTTI